jgi:hypothetical protein
MASVNNRDREKLSEMVDRDNGIEEVVGSIPYGSTVQSLTFLFSSANVKRDEMSMR